MSEKPTSELPSLPCYPCPYNASCCAYGATVSDEEAAAIIAAHGADKVYQTRWGEWRTRVKNKRCVMLRDGACIIHAQSYYPTVCRGFPWVDAEGDRYLYDITICGEFGVKPHLVELQRALPSAGRGTQESQRSDAAYASSVPTAPPGEPRSNLQEV